MNGFEEYHSEQSARRSGLETPAGETAEAGLGFRFALRHWAVDERAVHPEVGHFATLVGAVAQPGPLHGAELLAAVLVEQLPVVAFGRCAFSLAPVSSLTPASSFPCHALAGPFSQLLAVWLSRSSCCPRAGF